jgi:hypothetical protein
MQIYYGKSLFVLYITKKLVFFQYYTKLTVLILVTQKHCVYCTKILIYFETSKQIWVISAKKNTNKQFLSTC